MFYVFSYWRGRLGMLCIGRLDWCHCNHSEAVGSDAWSSCIVELEVFSHFFIWRNCFCVPLSGGSGMGIDPAIGNWRSNWSSDFFQRFVEIYFFKKNLFLIPFCFSGLLAVFGSAMSVGWVRTGQKDLALASDEQSSQEILFYFLKQREPHTIVFLKRLLNLGIVGVCLGTFIVIIFPDGNEEESSCKAQ